jgi:hypothetical protein
VITKFLPALVLVLTLAGPRSVFAAGPGLASDSMSGAINVQRGALDAQVMLDRGSVALNASMTENGPEGQFTLSVPGAFSLQLSNANGSVQSAVCGVVGAQQLTASGGPGSGVHVQFSAVDGDQTACGQPAAASAAPLTMGPMLTFAQAAPTATDSSAALQDLLDGLRRLLILALLGGLLFVFVPHLAGPLRATAERAPWSRLGLGLCLAIALPVLGIAIFIVGLPLGLWWLGLLVLMADAFLIALSLTVAGLVLGAYLLDRIGDDRVPVVVAYAAGLIVLIVLSELPVIGGIVALLGHIYGMGALVMLPRARAAAAPVETITVTSPAASIATVAPPIAAEPIAPPAATTTSEAATTPAAAAAPQPAPDASEPVPEAAAEPRAAA